MSRPLSALVVDDEALARQRLRTLLADCQSPLAVCDGEAANAVQALDRLQHQRFDLVLLDIHMPGADGLAIARSLGALPHPPAVVFVTAHAEHAVAAFELDAVDYLTKPVRLERLQAALQKVERVARAAAVPVSDEYLLIEGRQGVQRIPLGEVLYLRAEAKSVTLHTRDACHTLFESLNEIEQRHPGRLVRIHRNTLVARAAVRALVRQEHSEEGEGWMLQLSGLDEWLPVSRRQLAAVRALLSG